ncbi:MAG: hypothetical protein HQK53_09670, partial [Oligoflexia bacterium]|nr:hypothetical protein [Oligoflexia bacterium]
MSNIFWIGLLMVFVGGIMALAGSAISGSDWMLSRMRMGMDRGMDEGMDKKFVGIFRFILKCQYPLLLSGVATLFLFCLYLFFSLDAGGFLELPFPCANLFSAMPLSLIFPAIVNFANPSPVTFRLDHLSIFFLLIISAISLLSLVYAQGYFKMGNYVGKASSPLSLSPILSVNLLKKLMSYFFLVGLLLSMVLVVASNHLLLFILFWEFMSISSLALVLYDYERKSTRKSAFYYFLFTQLGTTLILAALALIYWKCGSWDYNVISATTIDPESKMLIYILLLLGVGSKAGIFPLHIWLPYAHPVAPAHISALLSGVMIKVALYIFLRFYFLLHVQSLTVAYLVLLLGVLSIFFGAVYSVGQNNFKRLLAYCSVENIGIIWVGFGLFMLGDIEKNYL